MICWRHEDIPAQNIAYALGMVVDKVNTLKGRPQSVTANVNMGFGPKERTREEMIRILSGEQDLEEKDEKK